MQTTRERRAVRARRPAVRPGEAKVPAFQRPPTAQEAVLAELRRRIAGGELRPGAAISDVALSAELGISRIPVREALNVLVGEGHVAYRPHRGYAFVGLSLDDLVECYRLRELLDEEGIRVAVTRLTDEDVDRLEAARREVEHVASRSNDIVERTTVHRQFHVVLVEASGMRRLAWLTKILSDATDAFHAIYYVDPRHRHESLDRQVLEEHEQIVTAMRARDAEGAIHILRLHRQRAVDRLREIFERHQEGSKK